MDVKCLDHCLTETERLAFERDGYFIVEDALPESLIDDAEVAADRVDSAYRAQEQIGTYARSNVLDFIGEDDVFLDLLDWYKTFPKVWGLLGWNIQLYHTHLVVTPPAEVGKTLANNGLELRFHQDTGRLNIELESNPRPRISIKVAFFLSDTSEPNRGNFYVLPGSHLSNGFSGDRQSVPNGALPVLAPRGAAVFFDRRLWHSATANYWQAPRKALFYGYSYRWLRPRDNMTVGHYLDRCDPIRQQLLGASPSGGFGYTSPKDVDVPLKTWIEEHVGAEAVAF